MRIGQAVLSQFALAGIVFLATGITGASSAGQGEQTVNALTLGAAFERDLKSGEAHDYQVTLASGQYLRAVVEQAGIDVVVKVFGPQGQQLDETDSPNGAHGPEPVAVVADAPGGYRLRVSALEANCPPGRYKVRVEELRAATPQDQNRIAAQRASVAAARLAAQATTESRQKAIQKYEEALALWAAAGDRAMQAQTLNHIGDIYVSLRQPKALDSYNRALALWRAVGDRRGEGDTLHNLGLVFAGIGLYQKALDHCNQALALRQELGDRAGQAETLDLIGMIYNGLGERQKAFESYRQALSLWQAAGDRGGEALTLHNIGFAHADLGEPQKALDYYKQALPLRRAVNSRGGEAQTLTAMGWAYSVLGEKQMALDCYDRALRIRRAMGDRRGEAYTLYSIGLTYSALGEELKALDYYNQALPLRRATSDRRGEAYTLIAIGFTYNRLGEARQALDYLGKGLALCKDLGDRRAEGMALGALGFAYDSLGEAQKALDYLGQARSLLQTRDRFYEAMTLNRMGKIYYSLAEPQKALDAYGQALQLHRSVGDRDGEADTLYGIARVERDRGNLNEARAHIQAALDLIESLRTRVAGQELRAAYLASNRSLYEFSIDLWMRQHQREPLKGHDAAALETSERARARSLLEILTEARADIRQGVDPALLERERALRNQLNAKEAYRVKLLGGKHTPEQADAAKREIADLLTRYRETQAHIRAASPRYAALTQPAPLSLKEIQQQVLDEDTLLLEYALGAERSYLWAVTPTSLASYELPGQAEIEAAARRVYELTSTDKRERRVQGELAAAELSRMLLGPVAGQLKKKRLVIVAEGALQYVPFAALPEPPEAGGRRQEAGGKQPSTHPLIVEHEIISLPSASALATLRRELAGRPPASKTIAVLADPVFQPTDPRIQPGSSGQDSPAQATPSTFIRSTGEAEVTILRRLPFSRGEAEAIATLARDNQSLKALDFAASRALATGGELEHYRVVHFATHGLLNSRQPELSGVALSLVDERGQPQDGFLRLHDIYNLKLRADLVVLSACQTALGKEVKGEGLVGLTRGFMYAGAARVIASLWNVEDEATAELMKRFYTALLKEGQTPAAALRAAQVSMWRERRWQAPYHWAAFVLQGEWR